MARGDGEETVRLRGVDLACGLWDWKVWREDREPGLGPPFRDVIKITGTEVGREADSKLFSPLSHPQPQFACCY